MCGIHDSFSGSIAGEVLTYNPDAIPQPEELHIRMTRGERYIADELRKAFGGFKRVIIDVDGEQHEFSADSFIRLLEGYEGAWGTSKYEELFGTPERAARTLRLFSPFDCPGCALESTCGGDKDVRCFLSDYSALLEWLRGDA